MKTPPFPDLDELLQRLLDGQIEADELKRLQEAMLQDPQVRRYYLDTMFAYAVMRRCRQGGVELSERDLIEALASDENKGTSRHLGRRLFSVAAILILGALVFAVISLFRHKAHGPELGGLSGAYEARWEGARPRPGEPLRAGSYSLSEGLAKMELGQGTSLLLEAPCRVELTSIDEVTLKEGTLTTVVPPQARGFRVRTPTALITDLGTGFGVIAHSDGRTEAHVLKGHINIALDPNRSGRPRSLVVNEGSAAVVDARGLTIQGGLAARADLFLVQLPSVGQPSGLAGRLNLADIVGGGNGRGAGTLDQGIDLGTGQAFKHPTNVLKQSRQNVFQPTPQFPGIDGVFVPNAALGPVVISSTGLVFSECPQTAGSYYGGPANSGKFFGIRTRQTFAARLDGINYGTLRHPALNLHPNAGITFDLAQIRQDNPRIQIDRFTAVCGIPKEMPHAQVVAADAWVLLDGVVRLRLHYPTDRYVVEKVDVPIPAETRFLTLITTCPGDAGYSWLFFGDPFLESAAAK